MKNSSVVSYITNHFKHYNTDCVPGEDGRYHTVYLIEFKTGQYYIGKHTSNDLTCDNYFCSGKLPIYLRDSGVVFGRYILFYLNTSEEAILCETQLLQCKYLYENELCLNCYPGSPPDCSGSVVISKGEVFKMINPKLLCYYLDLGWKQQGLKMICVYNFEGKTTRILPSKVEYYISNGWMLGSYAAKNKVFMEKDGKRIMVKRTCVLDMEQDGWILKHNIQDYKVIKKDGRLKKVPPHELNDYLLQGFEQSSTVDGLIYIKKDGKYKRVSSEELQKYLDDGWEKGNNHTGKIYVNNGTKEKRVNENEIEDGWVKGRLKRVYLNNGVKERRLYECDTNSIQEYIANGYVVGKLKRRKHGNFMLPSVIS